MINIFSNPAYEQIAADSYWDGPVRAIDNYASTAIKSSFDKTKAYEVGNLVLDMTGGFSSETIPQLGTIAQPTSGTRRVIRIIEDARKIKRINLLCSQSPFALLLKFEEKVAQMGVEDELYSSYAAKVKAPYNQFARVAVVSRSVYYLRYSDEDGDLYGLESFSIIDGEAFVKTGVARKPAVNVGEIFKYDFAPNCLRKVISADILEPMGSLRKPPRYKRRPKEHKQVEGVPLSQGLGWQV